MRNFFILVGCSSLLMACASSMQIGAKPSDNPPRLSDDKSKQGMGWDRPEAFGPVPANLQATGDAVCRQASMQSLNKAFGYHPKALDKTGQPIAEGGYLCGN